MPGYEAPVNLVYSARNRSACVRVPMYHEAPKTKRIEFRSPDPTANPYLAFSALMMAGLDGIKRELDPGEPLDADIYELPEETLAKIATVPSSLEASLDALEADNAFLLEGDVFTPGLIEAYVRYKREEEVDAIRMRPHPWEFALYHDCLVVFGGRRALRPPRSPLSRFGAWSQFARVRANGIDDPHSSRGPWGATPTARRMRLRVWESRARRRRAATPGASRRGRPPDLQSSPKPPRARAASASISAPAALMSTSRRLGRELWRVMQPELAVARRPIRATRRDHALGGRGWVFSHSSRVGSLPALRAARTHSVWAWRRRLESPSGYISRCSLSAGRWRPHSGQR